MPAALRCQAVSFEDALEEIVGASGRIYDPEVIQAALRASDEIREYIGKIVFSGMDHEQARGFGPDQ